MNQDRCVIEIIEDPDTKDLILPIPDHILATLNWKEGDVLIWSKIDDTRWSITKKENQNE
jgi:hypothetical protein